MKWRDMRWHVSQATWFTRFDDTTSSVLEPDSTPSDRPAFCPAMLVLDMWHGRMSFAETDLERLVGL